MEESLKTNMNGYLDKKQCFEPESVLMEQILAVFDAYCKE